jgi:hypothetical protein
VLSPDEEKEISIQEKKKESLLWKKPAPPKPYLGSYIHGFKYYRKQSMGKLYFVGF